MNDCEGIGINWDAKNPLFEKAYSVAGAKVEDITDTTRLRIMRTLHSSYEDGLSIDETATALGKLKGLNAARARMIARTEMTAIVNGATNATADVLSEALGVTYLKEWVTAPGAEHPRHEDYEGLDGQQVEMGELFNVGDSQLEYPGDPDGPADEVVNCRCTILLIEQGGSQGREVDTGEEGLIAAAPSPESAMVACYPDPAEAAVLALPGGELAKILHVTLAFLGELTAEEASSISQIVGKVAPLYPMLEGEVGGIASFAEGPDGYPSILLPDVPGLAELHMAVCYALYEAGIDYAGNHGWTPHLTLSYEAVPTLPPADRLKQPLTFQWLTVSRGDVRTDHLLAA